MTRSVVSRLMFVKIRGRFADRLLEVLVLIAVVIHDLPSRRAFETHR